MWRRAEHALREEHLHGVAKDGKEEDASAEQRRRRREPAHRAALAASMAVGEGEAYEAGAEQEGRELIVARVALAQKQAAEGHRRQQFA